MIKISRRISARACFAAYAHGAQAQQGNPSNLNLRAEKAAPIEEIVVTGTRVSRAGSIATSAPTTATLFQASTMHSDGDISPVRVSGSAEDW
jgi:hypothetical protein